MRHLCARPTFKSSLCFSAKLSSSSSSSSSSSIQRLPNEDSLEICPFSLSPAQANACKWQQAARPVALCVLALELAAKVSSELCCSGRLLLQLAALWPSFLWRDSLRLDSSSSSSNWPPFVPKASGEGEAEAEGADWAREAGESACAAAQCVHFHAIRSLPRPSFGWPKSPPAS